MKGFSVFLFLALAGCGTAQVASEVKSGISSNGGQATVCRKDPSRPGQKVYSLLDYSEAEHSWGLKLALESEGDWKTIARKTLARLRKFDSERERRYLAELEAFESKVRFTDNVIDLIKDNNGAELPNHGCELLQAAVRRKPELPSDKLYTISTPVWNALPEAHKAGLVLHEIILDEALSRGQTTSRLSRYYNAKLAANWMGSESLAEYEKLLKVTDLYPEALTLATAVAVNGSYMFFRSDGTISHAPRTNQLRYRSTECKASSKSESDLVAVMDAGGIVYHPSGSPALARCRWDFCRIPFVWNGLSEIAAAKGSVVEFYPDATVKAVTLARGEVFESKDGNVKVAAGNRVTFDEQGLVINTAP